MKSMRSSVGLPVNWRAGSFGIFCLVCSSGAWSQDSSDDSVNDEPVKKIELVIVTGSRIPRDGFESLQPTLVLDGVALELRGNLNVADSLNEQSGFGLPGRSPIGGQGAEVGQNHVSFLGLGSQRTLTLVNGQRFPASGISGLQVDFNAIPSTIVDRVETISIGGAPIYGADAIAGTVNVILRDDYEGLSVSSSYGQSPEFGDAREYQLAATWGVNFADGRGNLLLTAEYNNVEGLKQTDRPATATDVGFEAPADPDSPFALQLFDDLTIAVDNPTPFPLFFGNVFFFGIFGNGIPLDITDPDSPLSAFDADGNLISFVPGGGTGSVIIQNGGDGLKGAELAALYSDLERYNANVFLTYDLGDSVRFKAEGWFARTDAIQIINQPGFNSPAFGGLPADGFGNVNGGPIPVLIDNPFLPAATRDSILAALNVVHDFDGDGIANPTIDTDGDGVPDAVGFWRGGPLTGVVGDNANGSRQDTYRGIIGFDGDLDLAGRSFAWDLTYAYGHTENDLNSTEIVQPNFEQAVQVVVDANGNPACADPSGGCVPLNVVGTPTTEAIAYVSAAVTNKVSTEQNVFSANITGELFELPTGSLAAAAGFAYRDEQANFQPNSLALNGQTRFSLVPISGGFDSTELYAEFVIPLLGGKLETPLVESLEFEAAIRWVDNSIAGSEPTWTAGLRYRPIEALEFRGNYTESIRAPSILELFTPELPIGGSASDPCDERFIDSGNFPERRAANCAAAGIIQPFQSFIVNASQRGTVSGNDQLNSETADSYTFGLIFRPSFLNGFSAAIDWMDIEIDGAIANLSINSILAACYDSAGFPNEPVCDRFTRDANGQVIDFRSGFVNINRIEFSGLQAVVSYDVDLQRYGTLDLNLNYLHTDEHLVTRSVGNPLELAGTIGSNKDRVTASATWNKGKWVWFTQLRYLSDAVFSNTDTEFTRDIKGVGDWYVFDTSVGYDIGKNISLQLNIDNFFDKHAPFAAVASGDGITTYYSGIIGRMAHVTVRASF